MTPKNQRRSLPFIYKIFSMAAISYHFIDQEKIKFTYKITLQTMGGCPFSYDMPQRGPVFSVGCTGQPT